jgi:hypothetical protein
LGLAEKRISHHANYQIVLGDRAFKETILVAEASRNSTKGKARKKWNLTARFY